MSEVMHEASQHDTFLLAFRKRWLLTFCLALLFEDVHLQVAEVGDSTAVFESVVGRAWEHVVVRAQLVEDRKSTRLNSSH